MAIATGVLVATRDSRGPADFRADRVVRLATPGAAANAEVEIGRPDGAGTAMRLVASGLPHGAGRYYGVWLTGSGGAVSGGSFMPDGDGRCVVMLEAPPGHWTAVAITTGDRPPSRETTVASASL